MRILIKLSMEIREINNKTEWEDFVLAQKPHTFLQSWNWGGFNLAMGNKIWRFGIYEKILLGAALVVKISARRGKFLFIPHGPLISFKFQVSSFKFFLNHSFAITPYFLVSVGWKIFGLTIYLRRWLPPYSSD